MPLVTSGEISIGGSTANRSINLELGRAAGATSSLGETSLRNLAGVASGPISLSDFYGKSNLAATLPDYGVTAGAIELSRFYYDAGASYGEAYVDIILNPDGTGAYRYGDSGTATTNFTSFTWKTGGGSAGDYFAHMATPSGGSFSASSSATNSALALSSARLWGLLLTSSVNPSDVTAALASTLQIRKADGTALVSKSVAMDVGVQLGTPL
jgi:hypothetical protein